MTVWESPSVFTQVSRGPAELEDRAEGNPGSSCKAASAAMTARASSSTLALHSASISAFARFTSANESGVTDGPQSGVTAGKLTTASPGASDNRVSCCCGCLPAEPAELALAMAITIILGVPVIAVLSTGLLDEVGVPTGATGVCAGGAGVEEELEE